MTAATQFILIDIVFFGESLPSEFYHNLDEDSEKVHHVIITHLRDMYCMAICSVGRFSLEKVQAVWQGEDSLKSRHSSVFEKQLWLLWLFFVLYISLSAQKPFVSHILQYVYLSLCRFDLHPYDFRLQPY